MKNKKILIISLILICFVTIFSGIGVEAKGSSGGSSSRSTTSRSTTSKSSGSSFKSGSFSSPKSSSTSPTTKSITPKPSSKDTTTKSSSTGTTFKTGDFSNTKPSSTNTANKSSSEKTPTKATDTSSTNKGTTTKPTVNTNSTALKNIPTTYSSHSVSNHYYYNVDNGGSNFWSHYWMYRALSPEHRTYVAVGGSNQVAPAYTGFSSIIADVVTWTIIIAVSIVLIYIFKKRRK